MGRVRSCRGRLRRAWFAGTAATAAAAVFALAGPTLTAQTGCPGGEPGELLWAANTGEVVGSPAVGADGAIYVAVRSTAVHSLDCSGRIQWTWTPEDEGLFAQAFHGAPALGDDGTIHIADDILMPNYLFALNPDGTLKWQFETHAVNSGMDVSPAVDAAGRVFVGSAATTRVGSSGLLFGFDADGSLLSGYPADSGPVVVPPVILDDTLVAFFARAAIPMGFPPTAVPTPSHTPAPTGTVVPSPTPQPSRTTGPTVTPKESPAPAPVSLPFVLARQLRGGGASGDRWPGYATGRNVDGRPGPNRPAAPADRRQSPLQLSAPPILHVAPLDGEPFPLMNLAPPDTDPPLSLPGAFGRTLVVGVGRSVQTITLGQVTEVVTHPMPDIPVGAPALGALDSQVNRLEVLFTLADGSLTSWTLDLDGDEAPALNWSTPLRNPVDTRPRHPDLVGSPVLGDDGLVYAAGSSQLVAFDRDTGRRLWVHTLEDGRYTSAPVMAPGGMLLVGTSSGLLAFVTGAGGPDPVALWPSSRGDPRNTGRGAPEP